MREKLIKTVSKFHGTKSWHEMPSSDDNGSAWKVNWSLMVDCAGVLRMLACHDCGRSKQTEATHCPARSQWSSAYPRSVIRALRSQSMGCRKTGNLILFSTADMCWLLATWYGVPTFAKYPSTSSKGCLLPSYKTHDRAVVLPRINSGSKILKVYGCFQNGWFTMENPINLWMIWGYHHFPKRPYMNHEGQR